jgi:hypothetical protein
LVIFVQTGTLEWFEKIKKQHISDKNEEDSVKGLVDVVNIVMLDSHIAIKYYKPIFEK